ncbi:DNA-directed DNA polymerase alpha subunit pol12 [Polyrhizophydium stewartii]|uniref:DNA polymerase alpha subunit B n=1 Tax=Polyrhizophydium stewartii TaxID=2732419 RepID=A0ABR4NDQ8_9FUNG
MTHGSSQAPGAYGAASLGALVAGGARPKLVPVAPRADAAASEAAPPRTPQPPRTRGAALASPPFGASAASPAGAAAAGRRRPARPRPGPFTLDSDLDFEPLEALAAEVVAVDPPDLVVLLGPFVDIDHPLIAAGIVGSDVDEIFAAQVAPRLDRMRQARPGLQIALVPSARDACSEWIAFPQPPLAAALSPADAWARRDALGLLAPTPDRPGAKAPKDGIFLFPNPVQFRFNEIVFAVSSTDILFDLAAAECAIAPRAAPDAASQPLLASDAQLPPGSSPLGGVSQARAAAAAASASIAAGDAANDPDGDDDDDDAAQAAIDDDSLERSDKISRMFGHLLRQRSFYPLFPPAPSACLDLSRALALTTTDADGSELPGPLVLQAVPDVFIIPSRLHPVVRPVASALCINPGFLAKGRAAGTYARLCIHPLRIDAADAADADTAVEHAVPQRTAVEIRRI